MRLRLVACWFWGWMMVCSTLMAQVPAYTQYMLDDGLASSTVYAAIQDREGFIWFATEAGVSRFDGTNFRNFTTSDGLPANDILNLYQDRRGRIWFFPYFPAVCYYQDGKIHNGQTDPWLNKIGGRTFIPSFFEDSKGNMWFGDDAFMIWKLTPDGELKDYCPTNLLGSLSFWRFFETADGKVMVSGAAGIVQLEPMRIVEYNVPWLPINYQRATHLGRDSLLVGTDRTIALIHDGQTTVVPGVDTLVDAEIISLYADAKHNLWIGTRNGVIVLLNYQLTPQGFSYKAKKKLLPSKEVTSVLVDDEGNYWFTSLTQGVFFFPDVGAITYANAKVGESSFANRVSVDRKGDVWVGFDHGHYGRLIGESFEMYEFPFPLVGRGRTNEIYEDLQGNLYLANDQASVMFAADGRKKFYQGRSYKAICQTGTNKMIAGVSYELHEVEVTNSFVDFFEQIALSHHNRSHSAIMRVIDIYQTRAGQLFLGAMGGLMRREGAGFEPVPEAPTAATSAIAETQDGIVWISTLSQGVGYFFNERFFPITQADGLASDICYGFAIDDVGKIFVATNDGISCIEILSYPEHRFQIQNMGTNVGLASAEVRDVDVANGKIYAATANGLTVLNATQLTAAPRPVRMVISQVSIGDSVLPNALRPFVLDRGARGLTVSYGGISYRNAPNLTYAYQLVRDDEPSPWVKTSSRRLEFPVLQPGSYRLSLAGYIQGWEGTTSTAVIQFEIRPQFWETNSFRIVILAVIVLSMLGIFWLILRRLKLQARRRLSVQKRISDLEQQALRSQMNPHFIFNSLNSIEHFFVQGRQEEGNQFIADFSALMRAVLDASSKQVIPLCDELRLIELFMTLESHRLNAGFDFTITTESDIDPEDTIIPPLILQPIVENAIWHGVSRLKGEKGLIEVRARRVPGGLCITIDDNGIGREQSAALKAKYRQKHRSSGLRIIQERFDLLNGNLEPGLGYRMSFHDKHHASGRATGTQVAITIPLTEIHPIAP